jgi:hypothetical protein
MCVCVFVCVWQWKINQTMKTNHQSTAHWLWVCLVEFENYTNKAINTVFFFLGSSAIVFNLLLTIIRKLFRKRSKSLFDNRRSFFFIHFFFLLICKLSLLWWIKYKKSMIKNINAKKKIEPFLIINLRRNNECHQFLI